MKHCAYHPKSESERNIIATINCQCLVNIATCTQQTKEWTVSIRACDTVLSEIDYKCAKALYRRAQARSIPLSCGATENHLALQDMKEALRYLNEQRESGGASTDVDGDSGIDSGVRVINSNALVADIPALYNKILADYKELSSQLQSLKKKDKNRNTKIFNGEVSAKDTTPGAATVTPTSQKSGSRTVAPCSKDFSATENKESSGSGGVYYVPEDDQVPSVEEYNQAGAIGADSNSKGNIRTAGSSRQGREAAAAAGGLPKSIDDMTMEDVQTQMRDMEAAAKRYEVDRQPAKARELRAKVGKMHAILEEHGIRGTGEKTAAGGAGAGAGAGNSRVQTLPDFANPTAEMIEEARRLHGLDLTDPRVQEMLAGLQKEHAGGPAGTGKPRPSGARSSSGATTSPKNIKRSTSGSAGGSPEEEVEEDLARSLRTTEYRRVGEKFLEDYTTVAQLRPLLFNRHYNGLAVGFRASEALSVDLSTQSPEAVRTLCLDSLVADWHHLAENPPSTSSPTSKDKKPEGDGDKLGDSEKVMDGKQLETVLMMYLPTPSLTGDMVTLALSGAAGNAHLAEYLQAVLKQQMLTTMASGTIPYWIGLLISIFLMFLYNTMMRSERVYNEAVNVFETNQNTDYGSL